MDPLELARWTRFASKGGIGRCTALRNHIAQESEDLMFLENDEIIVLMQISVSEDLYLGSCEDVVGRFYGSDVRMHGKLKKPVFTKRPTSVTTSASPTPPSSRAPTFSSPPLTATTPDYYASSPTSGSDYLSRNPSVTYGSPLPSTPPTPAAQTPEMSPKPPSPIPTSSITEDLESDSGTEEGQILEIRVQTDTERNDQLTAVPNKNFHNFRRPVLSTIYVPAEGTRSSLADIATPKVYTESDSQAPQLTGSPIGTRSLYGGGSVALYGGEEEREGIPAYAGRSSVFAADRASTFSDGRMGIGLSLLQGMENGDRMSDLWSESGGSGESIADHHFPPPPNTVPFSVRGSKVSINNPEGGKRSATTARASMRSMGASEAGEWDGDDIYGDYYRNSHISVNSKLSGRSRTASNANAQHEVPPIPDLEYRRPSLETASISSGRSPTPEDDSVKDGPPQPTSLLPEKTKPLNIRKQGNSPEPASFRNNYNMVPLHTDNAPSAAGPSAFGVPSVMRQTLESDSVESSISSSRPSQNTEPVIGDSPTRSPQSGFPSGTSKGLSFPPAPPPSQEPQARPRVQNSNSATALGMPRAPSLFMPHPHAPKAMDPSTGQVSSRSQAIYEAMSSNKDVLQSTTPVRTPGYSMSLLGMLALAATKAKVKATTVYGQTQVDLSTSFNPVPITFSLDGQPENSRAARTPGPKNGQIGRSNTSDGVIMPESPKSPKKVAPIPRANFFPKVGTARPRSRSFSGFSGTEVAIPMATSVEEGSNPGDGIASLRASLRPQQRGRTSPSTSGTSSPRSGSPSNQTPHGRTPRPIHVPSPLSLPAINSPEAEPFLSSDIPPSPLSPMAPPSPGAGSIKHPGISRGLRQIASNAMLKVGLQPDPSSRVTRNNSGTTYNDLPLPEPSQRDSPPRVLRRSPSNLRVPPPPNVVSIEIDSDRDLRSDLSTPLLSNGSASSSPVVRNISLRSKLSKSGLRNRQGGGRGYEPRPGSTHQDNDEARVQIQDMEFELVKPVIKAPELRGSEDGVVSVNSADDSSTRDGETSDSPILSPSAGSGYSAGFGSSVDLYASSSRTPISPASVEAHRIREQKWMSLISTSSNSRARKNKKARKLILDGVPSSVRGKAWGAITDAKARRMEGLFTQLVKKAPSHFIPLVERDVERCFGDVQHLRDPKGPLASLILAYTAMVPDIRYRTGLTLIAGHLLLQAPDEDAFWMFVAIMDSHLRGYYQINSHSQIEIDSNLFRLLVQAMDPELAQRLFEDYGIRPVDICGPWFSCMFAGIVPPDHLYRLWDVLLYDGKLSVETHKSWTYVPPGPIYLFRIALTLLTLLKRPLMNMPSPEVPNVLDLLQRPPVAALPPDPDGLLAHTFNVKFRDEDVRKQRSKLEAQLKQQRAGAR